jgi:hypothetical protein
VTSGDRPADQVADGQGTGYLGALGCPAVRFIPAGQFARGEVAAVSRPQVIDDEERERAHDKVAAIDVAKDAGVVCTRTPHPYPSRPGTRRSTGWTVKARMDTIRKLGRQLKHDGIEIVTPFVWTKSADDILETIAEYCRRAAGS